MSAYDISDTQREAVAAVEEHGSYRAAAKALGRDEANVRRACQRAARHGVVPHNPHLAKAVPPGGIVGKNTIQMNEDGTIARQWPRLHPGVQQIEEYVDGLCERVAGKAGRIRPASKAPSASMNEVVVGDPHAGMYAWAAETGSSYDLDIFKRLHTEGPAMLLDGMGDSEHAIFAVLGDTFHADNMKTTEKSGNVLDVDGRFDKVIDTGINAFTDAIDDAAKRCKFLKVVFITGNHSPRNTKWLQRVLRAYYQNTKHIEVVTTPRNRTYVEWNSSLLGYHHGDRIDANKLQMTMAQEEAEAWGRTIHRYWRCGHFHVGKRFRPFWDCAEAPGCLIEYFPVLAGLEAYGAEAGYSSRRALIGIQHHEKYGEIGRRIITPQMLHV